MAWLVLLGWWPIAAWLMLMLLLVGLCESCGGYSLLKRHSGKRQRRHPFCCVTAFKAALKHAGGRSGCVTLISLDGWLLWTLVVGGGPSDGTAACSGAGIIAGVSLRPKAGVTDTHGGSHSGFAHTDGAA